jgi:hypothetical protein
VLKKEEKKMMKIHCVHVGGKGVKSIKPYNNSEAFKGKNIAE